MSLVRLVSGRVPGFRAYYYMDSKIVATRIEPRIELHVPEAEKGLSVRWIGFVKPPFSSTYALVIDAMGSVRVRIGGKELGIRRIGDVLVTRPVPLNETAYYRLEIEYDADTDSDEPPYVRVSWLRGDGVIEILDEKYVYTHSSNFVYVSGLRDGCRAILRRVGIIAEAEVRRGLAVLDIGDVEPPIEACLELECNGTRYRITTLKDVWGGDVYKLLDGSTQSSSKLSYVET